MTREEKMIDTYFPLYVSSRGSDGYFYIKGAKISHEKLFQLRNEWINDDNYDCSFNEFLDNMILEEDIK